MRALVRCNFDRVAHFDDIELVRVQRIEREIREQRRLGVCAMRDPPGASPGDKRHECGGDRTHHPAARRARQPIDRQPRGHRLVADGIVFGMQHVADPAP